jgi:hypothetical protein
VPLVGEGDKGKIDALSMSSIDMKTVMRLRLMRKPTTPSENSTALSSRYQESGTSCEKRNSLGGRPFPFSLRGLRGRAGQRNRAENRDEDEHRGDFKGQQQFVKSTGSGLQ